MMTQSLLSYVVAAGLAAAPSVPESAPTSEEPSPMQARAYAVEHDPQLRARDERARSVAIAGGVIGGFGAATLLFVTLPTEARYDRAEKEIADAQWATEQEAPRRRALRRRYIMRVSAGAGLGLLAAGGTMLVVGLVQRSRLRRAPSNFAVAPAVLPRGGGVAASVRF